MSFLFFNSHFLSVRKIYESISDGQLLHPDADDSDSEEEEEDGYVGGGLGMSNQIRFDSDGQVITIYNVTDLYNDSLKL